MKKSVFFSCLIMLLLSVFIVPASTQDAASAPITFSGTVEAIEGTTITVTGLKVDVSQIDPALVAQIQTGLTVDVTGTLANGVVTATALTLPNVAPAATDVQTLDGPQPNGTPNYGVVFNGSTFDGASTTFTYTVTGTGVSPALSHFDIEIPRCTPALEVTAYSPTDAVELVVDPTTGVDGMKWDLPLGESESRTYSFTFRGYVAEGDVATAVKNGDGFFITVVKGPSCAQPELDVEKYVTADGGATWVDADAAPGLEIPAGGQVSYRFVLTNSGNVPLTTLTLSDNTRDTSACVLPATLAPDASFECVVGPIPASDGVHTNIATATAQYETITVDDTDAASHFTGVNASVNVEKYVSIGGGTNWIDADTAPGVETEEGTPVLFRFVVTNTGNVALSTITLADNIMATTSCVIPATLAPNGVFECVVGPTNATSGLHTNTATVTASANGTNVIDTDDANYTGRTGPVTIRGYVVAFVSRIYANGQTTFTYSVSGTGTPPDLSHFDIEIPVCPTRLKVVGTSPTDAVSFGIDPTTGVNGVKWDLPLKTNENRLYSITFEGNVAQGMVLAAVKGGPGFTTLSVPGPLCDVASINVEKYISLDNKATWLDADATPGMDAELDGQVFFRFLVTNNGTSALTGISLTDNKLDLTSCVKPASLAAGAFFECVVGPIAVVAGQHSNTATAQGVFGDGSGTTIDTDIAHYFGGDRPAIDVEGYVSSNGGATWIDADGAPGLLVDIGDGVSYRFIIKNIGNVALTGLTLTDNVLNTASCAIPSTLEPGTSFTCDVAGAAATEGPHSNRTTATGTANGVTVTDTDATAYTGGDIDVIVVVDDDATDVIIIIEGPIDSINGNIITIFGIEIEVDVNDPILTTIKIGDFLRIEGNSVGRGDTIIIIAITIVIVDIDIIVPNNGGNNGGPIVVPAGCKITGKGNGNPRLKCSNKGSGSKKSS